MATIEEIVGQRVEALRASGVPISRQSKLGKAIRSRGVSYTSELGRIIALPRRRWEADPDIEAITREVTELLLRPGGEKPCSKICTCPRALWPNQAVSLLDCATVHGLFGPSGVGKGKALISVLAPVIMQAERPVLFVPAQLREQTTRKVLPMLARHWRLHKKLRVVGYSELSLAKNKRMLFELQPDVLVLDEAHSVRNTLSARGKRVEEYMKAHPETRVVDLSGTMMRRSIRDYERLMRWALKPDRCPLPGTWEEVKDWADALDEGIAPQDRMDPGAIMSLCEDGEDARDGYRRRLVETPGIVATSDEDLGCSLVLREEKVRVPKLIADMMAAMRRDWETPRGDIITEPVELWRHMRELACGFFYRWEPSPPSDWLDVRKAWHRYLREKIRHNKLGLDSPLVVANYLDALVREGNEKRDNEGVELLRAWREIKGTYEINNVAEWVSDFAIASATAWLNSSVDEDSPNGGICWVEHVCFGERLAEASGFPYFGAGKKASIEILDATGPIIASLSAHGEGKNLQARWRNLFTAPSSSGKAWEQHLGRTHRPGQISDSVEGDLWLHADELRASFRQALRDARYIEQTFGSRQKLNFADIAFEIGSDA